MNILHIDSSALGQNSASRELTAALVAGLRQQYPDASVAYRDLDREPLPHLSARTLAAADDATVAENAAVLQQFLDADTVVVGVPVYNFTIPTALKAWIDRIAVAGKTFRYTENGPEGLAGDKRVLLAVTRGGMRGADRFEEDYLRFVFSFFGIEVVESIRAEGLNLSPEHRQTAMGAALKQIAELGDVEQREAA
ncbi:MAG: NAD(P)H-dependent oxidoreductase [Xanthomonadales bacterium]|nr:NAD(P)H-dependent oxidoreductase [Xanthomonadales bacterium]